jgi:hypothetical protein
MSNEEHDTTSSEEVSDDLSEEGVVVAEQTKSVSKGTLVMFLILVVGGGSVYFMYRKTGPKSAAAASTETIEAKKTISTFLTSGDAGFKSMEARLKNTEKIVQQFLTYPSATQVPLTDLQTNPFRAHAPENAPDNTALSEAAKKKQQEEQRLTVKKAAEALTLQSVIASDTRKACMINSQLYREGETVGEFVIEKISPSAVLVKNGVYRFELRMQK